MKIRLSLWLSLVVLVAVVLAACAAPAAAPSADTGSEASTGPKRGGTLTLSLGPDIESFHPFYDLTVDMYKPWFYEAPLRIAEDGTFEPWLVESFERAEDGLSVTLHLREGIKFHNGRELTADDIIWSVDLARNTELGHHLSDRFLTCTGAVKIDERTVRVEYSELTASQLDGLARLYIFPQEAADTIEIQPVGTGPFRFQEWIPGDSLTAVRFEDYWQEGLPYLDEVVVKAIPDEQSRLVNLRSEAIDALYGVPLVEKAALEQEEGMVVGDTPAGFSFYSFMMNVNAPPFDNVKVRQAMQYAVNRERIAETVFHGEAEPVLVPYPPTSWAYAPDLENYYTYDLDKARALLAEAGYPDGFSVQMLVRGTDDPHLDQAQVYQQDLAAIGIQVELLPTELPQYWPQLFDSQFSIVSHKTGDATADPSGLFEGAACCRPFRNFFGIARCDEEGANCAADDPKMSWFPEYKEVIFAARAETDQAKRKELYHRALEIFLEQAWTVPTVWEQATYAHRDFVKNFQTDLDGLIWLHETWLDR